MLTGVNLTRHGPRHALTARVEASAVDGRPAVVVRYAADAPLPWRRVRDELRVLDKERLLCVSHAHGPGGARLALPFVLRRVAASTS